MFRALAFVALASKLLVPVGYMPAGLSEGGPFRLCDSRVMAVLAAAADGADAGAAAAHAGHGEGAAGETAFGASQWERCELAGLASVAAIGGAWQFVLPALAPEPPAMTAPVIVDQSAAVSFRSRAPPVLAFS